MSNVSRKYLSIRLEATNLTRNTSHCKCASSQSCLPLPLIFFYFTPSSLLQPLLVTSFTCFTCNSRIISLSSTCSCKWNRYQHIHAEREKRKKASQLAVPLTVSQQKANIIHTFNTDTDTLKVDTQVSCGTSCGARYPFVEMNLLQS